MELEEKETGQEDRPSRETSRPTFSLLKKVRQNLIFPLAWSPLLSFCLVGYFLGVKWGILAGWSAFLAFFLLLPGRTKLNVYTLFTLVFLVVAAASVPSLGNSLERRLPNLLAAAFASYLVMELFLLTEGGNFLSSIGKGLIPEERKDTPPVRRVLDALAWAWGGIFALGLAANLGALVLGPDLSSSFSAFSTAGLVIAGALLTPPSLKALVRRSERKTVERAPLWRESATPAKTSPAARPPSRDGYDVAVVGGGLGGLACALRLSQAGLKTVLLEKNKGVGGYCQTFQWEGYPLHAGPTFVGGSLLAWPGWEEWRKLLQGLQFRRLEWGLTDGRLALRLGGGIRRDYAKLSEKFPRDADRIKELLRDLLELREETRKGFPLEMIRPGDLASYRDGFRRFPKTSHLRHISFSSFLRGYGLRDELYGLLSGLAEVWGIPAERLPAIIGCFLLSDLFMDGIYVPSAGFSSLAREMAKMTHLAGGRVVVQAPVEQVKAKKGDGGAFTVRFRGGELESRAVVFGLDPRRIPGGLLPSSHFDEEYGEALASLKPSCTYFSLHLVYPEDLRLPDRVFLLPSRPKRIRLGEVRHDVRLVFIAKDPHPAGRGCSLLVRTPLPPSSFHLFQEDGELASELSSLLKEELFSIHPAAKGFIREFKTTPVHLHRLTGAGQGACFGFEATVHRWPFYLPGPSLPVPGAFLAGAWCSFGGGMHGSLLGGMAAAQRVLAFLGQNGDGTRASEYLESEEPVTKSQPAMTNSPSLSVDV